MTPTLPDGRVPENHFVPIKGVPKAIHDDVTPPHIVGKTDEVFRSTSPVPLADHHTKRRDHKSW